MSDEDVPVGTNQQRRLALYLGADRWWSDPVTEVVRSRQRFDAALLRSSLDVMMRRHAGLRTYFRPVAGGVGARLTPDRDARWPLHLHDVSAATDPGAERARILAGLGAKFDPFRPPLVRAVLVRDTQQDWLGFAFDHTVFDGGSRTPFMTDLTAVSGHLERGAPAELHTVSSRPADFYDRERRWLDGPDGGRARQFWAKQWAGLPSTAGAGVPGSEEPGLEFTKRLLGSRSVALMRTNANRLNCTRFMQVAAAVAVAVRRRHKDDDVPLSFIFSRRAWPGTKNMIGFLSCPVLLRLTVDAGEAVGSVARQVRREAGQAVRHGMFSYDQILREFYPDRYAVRPLLPHLTVNVVRLGELSALSLGSVPLEPADMPGGRAGDLGPGLHITLLETADAALLLGTSRAGSTAAGTVGEFMDDLEHALCTPIAS